MTGKGKFKNAQGKTECVEFVRQATEAPQTKDWKRGKKVSDARSSRQALPVREGLSAISYLLETVNRVSR